LNSNFPVQNIEENEGFRFILGYRKILKVQNAPSNNKKKNFNSLRAFLACTIIFIFILITLKKQSDYSHAAPFKMY